MKAIGIDIGGTGIKMAQVDAEKGELLSERIKVLTPVNGTPAEIVEIIKNTLETQGWEGPIGVGFPTPLRNGVCYNHSNLSADWQGVHIPSFMEHILGKKVVVGNDVDVAALGEIAFGNIPEDSEKVLFLALGTGIGSALFYRGQLIPGTEFGHLKYRSGIVEDYASNRVREEKGLSWKKWGKRLSKIFYYYDFVLDLDCIVLGGGVSRKFEKFRQYIESPVHVQPAELQNSAGTIGAALLAIQND